MAQRTERRPGADTTPADDAPPNGHTPSADDGDDGGEPPAEGLPEVDVDDGDDGDGALPWWRRAVDALTPQGPLQVFAGVVALCFLTGAVGYLIGTRNQVASSDVDTGFLIDMSSHHDQAVSLALCGADRATDPVVRGFAREVLVFQNRDLGTMGQLLAERDTPRPDDPDHPAMAWMGMPTTAQSMPGMAPDDQVQALCTATGTDADRQFLTLMRAHHEGGVHMADYAGEHATSPDIAELARNMAHNQRQEVGEYTQTLRRLGLGS